jgi:hypothetical protein
MDIPSKKSFFLYLVDSTESLRYPAMQPTGEGVADWLTAMGNITGNPTNYSSVEESLTGVKGNIETTNRAP